jgi:hypothetical protein
MARTAQPPRRPSVIATPVAGPRPAELTCSEIEAIVVPPSGSTEECAQAAAAVGYAPGLASRIVRPE